MFDTEQANYKSLRSIVKERTNPIVAWIGAGMSIPAGLPSWQNLKDSLCDALSEKERFIDNPEEIKRIKLQLNAIRHESNLWIAFARLLACLGDTTYVSTIRSAFARASTCEIPNCYNLLLSLPISGIINLNIDRLTTRAFSQQYPGKNLVEFSGRQCAEYTHILQSGRTFIVNLHGVVEDRTSWVFTIRDFGWLYDQAGYINFIKTVLCSKTLICVGVNAQDIALGSHLDRLKNEGIDFGAHFWITDRSDIKTDHWAEKAGLRLIHYNSDNDHMELREMLKDISAFVPEDVPVNPVFPDVPKDDDVKDLPLLEELESMTDEDVRVILNTHAVRILRASDKKAYEEFDQFCKKYDRYIYRSWYVSTIPPSNVMLGYRIKEQIAEGAFGRVFEAQDSEGQSVALKLLKYDVRHKPAMLQSFRRGVQSMRILEQHHVKGMIPYRNSSEIPAFAVMDLVDGPNLQTAVKAGFCDSWHDVLRIGVDLCTIIRTAHQLPERVLHRDIRPTNVMLRGYYADPDDYEVVVLDFDLSWYRGAPEESVMDKSTLNGFLAPEQIERIKGVSTRNAAVDSFGLGMTLYFIRTTDEPIYMEHRHRDWTNDLYKKVTSYPCRNWLSIPIRYARLIELAAKDEQSLRCDCSQLLGELQRLMEAEMNPRNVSSAELVAEEIAYGTCLFLNQPRIYDWNANKITGTLNWTSGVSIACIGDERDHNVHLAFMWNNPGSTDYKNVRKYLLPRCESAVSQLSKSGWIMESGIDLSTDRASFSMKMGINTAVNSMQNIIGTLSRVVPSFRF